MKKDTSDQRKDSICKPGSSAEDETSREKQLGKGKFFDDDDEEEESYNWLSSDNTSPSSFFEEYNSLSSSLHLCIDEWSVSWLSTLANSYLCLDKATDLSNGSMANPKRVPPLALERSDSDEGKVFQGRSGDEKRPIFPMKSPSATSSEDSSTSCDSSSTFGTTSVSSKCSCCRVSDLDGSSFSGSLVDLDDEDAKLISDADLNCFQFSLFPSSSWKSNWGSVVPTSNEPKPEDPPFDSEATELRENNSDDEPLFWPFEPKQHWNPEEVWKLFSMSPRNDTIKLRRTPSGTTASKPVGPKILGVKMDSNKESSKRKPVIISSSGSAATKILERKQRNPNNGIKRIKHMPSRLRKSTKIVLETVPVDVGHNASILTLKDDLFTEADFPIETLLGLDEFDGHEGVDDSELYEDIFALDDSL